MHSTDSFSCTDSFWIHSGDSLYELVIESFKQSINSATLIHFGTIRMTFFLWMSPWIIHSTDSLSYTDSFWNVTNYFLSGVIESSIQLINLAKFIHLEMI